MVNVYNNRKEKSIFLDSIHKKSDRFRDAQPFKRYLYEV